MFPSVSFYSWWGTRLPIPIAPLIIPSLLSGTEYHNSCKVGTLGQDLLWQGRAAALLSGEDLSNLIPRLYRLGTRLVQVWNVSYTLGTFCNWQNFCAIYMQVSLTNFSHSGSWGWGLGKSEISPTHCPQLLE